MVTARRHDPLDRPAPLVGSSRYAEVVFLVGSESLRRRIERIIERERKTVTWRELVPLRAVPYRAGLPACELADDERQASVVEDGGDLEVPPQGLDVAAQG